MKDMKVMQVSLDRSEWGSEYDENSNWNLFIQHSTFSHNRECEFILYVEDDTVINEYEELGFTKEVLGTCRNAKKQGFNYVCFYN